MSVFWWTLNMISCLNDRDIHILNIKNPPLKHQILKNPIIFKIHIFMKIIHQINNTQIDFFIKKIKEGENIGGPWNRY